jgi:ADP-ribose pyrophosphatase YjhB (NUDIX family)
MRSRLKTLLYTWYRLTHPVYATAWRIVQPTTVGVKAIVVDPAGRVLLVKPRYQRLWTLPGGGVHKRETPEDAAARELREETGIRVDADDLVLVGVLSNVTEGKSDYIVMFALTLPGAVDPIPGIEIETAGFYAQDALPEGTSPATKRRLSEFAGGRPMRGRW